MEYLHLEGQEDIVHNQLVEMGISPKEAKKILSFLSSNNRLLCQDESVRKVLRISEYDKLPPNTMQFILPSYDYYINIKITSIVLAALFLDIKLTKGFSSAFLALIGFSSTAIIKLNEFNGEKCIVRETLQTDPQKGSKEILAPFHGECCNNDLNCKFRKADKCACSKDDILAIYSVLTEKNMFKRAGDYFEYQW